MDEEEGSKMFGKLIQKARIEQGLTLKELCIRTGISDSYILRLEKSQRCNPTVKVISSLSEALNLDLKLIECCFFGNLMRDSSNCSEDNAQYVFVKKEVVEGMEESLRNVIHELEVGSKWE